MSNLSVSSRSGSAFTADALIVGGGIIGLALARELRRRDPTLRITVLEKEGELGRHASGRNSGVLHSGIYYPEGSLKARVCVAGAREMVAYCDEHALPVARTGKVIVPIHSHDDSQLDVLAARAARNGANVEVIDAEALARLEPNAHTVTGRALYTPDTAVVDPGAILRHLAADLATQGVRILTSHEVHEIDPAAGRVRAGSATFSYGHLYNAAGLHADRVAHRFGVGAHYTILPFKGIYYRLSPAAGLRVRHLIYPVPDLRYPFLGVHFTTKIDGSIYLGPTAIPALGRENYRGLRGIDGREAVAIGLRMLQQYIRNEQGFRALVHGESKRYVRRYFAEAARVLVPAVQAEHLLASDKAGIRAQLLDRRTGKLEMDFVVEPGPRSTHVLNAVSPGFTSAFSFVRVVLDQMGENHGVAG